MKLYNTATKKIEDFITYNKNIVNMYTCGPTVYHFAHIGNLRCYIMEDVLEKAFVYLGYKVNRVMNITDVGHLTSDSDTGEDKMLKGAKREKKSVLEIADEYTSSFFDDCNKLNIKKPDKVIKATSYINEYIDFINELLKKGYAYLAGGNVYFDTSKIEDYYRLTNHKEDEMVIGVREGVDKDFNKKNQADFVLWFTKSKFEDQELKWNSPWGVGYPGWHIECSVIGVKNCGPYLDLHCGGVDNIFPHHTNEIAQSEAYLGHEWCRNWFHVEHLNTESGKMSKSSGEFLTLSLLQKKGYSSLSYRFMCLQSHYRNQLVFSYLSLDNAQNSYKKLKSRVFSLKNANNNIDYNMVKTYQNKFKEALSNDLNTALAITCLYDVLKEKTNDETKLYLIKDFDKVLSLDLIEEEKFSDEIMNLVEQRNNAKKDKNFQLSDELRDELLSMGIRIIDSRDGTKLERL